MLLFADAGACAQNVLVVSADLAACCRLGRRVKARLMRLQAAPLLQGYRDPSPELLRKESLVAANASVCSAPRCCP